MNFFHNTRGETIAETILALMILAIGITFSGTIMGTSLKNMTSSKARVLAVNVAREGIEAARSIRDTNWLKFSGQRRLCWNHLPAGDPDACDGGALIAAGDYIVYKDAGHRWRLALMTDGTGGGFDNRPLYLMDIDDAYDTDGSCDGGAPPACNQDDEDLYNHQIAADYSAVDADDEPIGNAYAASTPFKRVIRIDYMADGSDAPATLDPARNRMRVTSTVTWSADRDFEVRLTTHLTDYLGRDSLGE